ncbi:MAG: hypothetical protein AAGB14_15875, partial [Verrucomicrobiota bacterium]
MLTSQARRITAAALVLLVAGIVRMPIEQSMTKDFREKGMLSEPLDVKVQKKLGQGFWAVSLGGLRSLVATIWNLRAFNDFENDEWTQLADKYETISYLAPNTDYYWDTGSWHMAYNAAAYYQARADGLPELRRRAEWRHWIESGTAFLEEGVRQNPDSGYLWSRLGWLYSDPNKIVDAEKAAEAYRRAVETGNALPFIGNSEAYALAQIPGREKEALDLIRERQKERRGQVPTMNCLRFTLESRFNPDLDPYRLALEIFGSENSAYQQLGGHFLELRKNYPMNGIAEVLQELESR